MKAHDLLLEIGVEELPASFVDAALRALPALAEKRFAELRIPHGRVRALGTPRRLALLVSALEERQPDLEQEVLGPPVGAAFDKAGAPTRAAEAFAKKVGVALGELRRVPTPKGEYLSGTRRESGRPTAELLGEALAALCAEIPFRKSMRWGSGDASFGRPVRWLVALYGAEVVPFSFAGSRSGRTTRGHRFLAPGEITLGEPAAYEAALGEAHVVVDPSARAAAMIERLRAGAEQAGGELIEDEFLVGENLSLVEEPHVIVGRFEERFLALPAEVILEVARGHQRYFGVRARGEAGAGRLLPRYLAVANTALAPEAIALGNDRVMRARLSDAQFFFDEDRKIRLEARAPRLEGIVFHDRLGSVGAKVARVVGLTGVIGEMARLPAPAREAARRGAELAKCDLVTLMVGEFPELQGVMGRAYALAQGEPAVAADAIRDHYLPRGAHDEVARAPEAAVVALADRLDTLAGCFAIGLAPTGAADPYSLRRACIGSLRTLLGQGWDLSLSALFVAAYAGYVEQGVKLDLDQAGLVTRLSEFTRERLRNLLAEQLPGDVVDACLAVASDRPVDARARARALSGLPQGVRAKVGEVFKRAANIAKEAPPGEPAAPGSLETSPDESESALFEAQQRLGEGLSQAARAGDYGEAFAQIAAFAPKLDTFFLRVFVMTEDTKVRDNRLRLLRSVRDACGTVAHVQLLQPSPPDATPA